MNVKLYIDNQQIDLFKDERIEVKSAITDAKDVSKNVGDYSKSFTVPASKNNNQIFKHYYDADIDNTFDARIKVDGRIEIDGLPFRTGKWRLTKVNVKSNQPASYTINFFGNLVSLKTKIKKDELTSLDISAFDHAFTSDNVKTGLQTGLFDSSIVYPLLAKKQYFYNSSSSSNVNTDTLANIAWNGNGTNGVIWNELRPAIKLIDIIEAIETKYNLSFTRDFFGRQEFDQLYMWLNPDSKNVVNTTKKIDWNALSTQYINFTTDDMTLPAIESPNARYYMYISPQAGYEGATYTLLSYRDGVLISENEYTGEGFKDKAIPITLNDTSVWNWYIRSSETIEFDVQIEVSLEGQLFYITRAENNIINPNAVVSNLFPKMKVIDFLKGLFSMFKLVTIPLNEEEIYVNTLDSYYSEGTLKDITRYVNFESYDVERGEIFNEINFKFSEPQTILNKQFEENTGIPYGDEELQLADENGEPLDGTTLDVKLPFEQVIYERLFDLNDNSVTNIMYGAIIDEEAEGTNIKPHIFYNVNTQIGVKTLAFQNDGGTNEELTGFINTPSHTINFTDMLYSTVFSAEFNDWDGELINNTLYKNYYEDYILSIFNVKRRNFRYKAILPVNILTSLSLNDILKIKDRYYRIDNFKLNLLTGDADLELINSFDNTINPFSLTNTIFFVDSNSQRVSSYVNGTDTFTAVKDNTGDGIDWFTATVTGRNILIDFDENITTYTRSAQIEVEEKTNFTTKIITLYQFGAGASLDFTSEANSGYLNTILIGKS